MSQAGRHSITVPLPKALPQAARKKVEAAVEAHLSAVQALTAFLDEADGDPDLEPSLAGTNGDDREYDPADPPDREGIDDDERDVSYNEGHGRGGVASGNSEDEEFSLGWTNAVNQDVALQAGRGSFSFGGGQWGSQIGGECEPSLGSLDGQINQNLWSQGNGMDLEHEHDGREPQGDEEPDIEADREPRDLPPFELNQENGGAL